jgi:hypothetical protein
MTGADAVGAAIARAVAGLSVEDAAEVRRAVGDGLADIDPAVGPEDLAIEIDAALDVPIAERVAAARRFASHRRAVRLARRSWELLSAFAAGEIPASAASARARDLLADVDAAIAAAPDEATRYRLGDYALEARFVLSGGAGPISLRGAKLIR